MVGMRGFSPEVKRSVASHAGEKPRIPTIVDIIGRFF